MLFKAELTSNSINDLLYSIFQGILLSQEDIEKYIARINELIKNKAPEDQERFNILLARTLSECSIPDRSWALPYAQEIVKKYPYNQQIRNYVDKLKSMIEINAQRFIPTIDEDGLYTTPDSFRRVLFYANKIAVITPDTSNREHYALYEAQAFIAADRFNEIEVNKCIDMLLTFPQPQKIFENNQRQIITRCAHALARTGDPIKATAILARLPEVQHLWPQEDWPEFWHERIGVIVDEQNELKLSFKEGIPKDLEFTDTEPSPTPAQIAALEKRIGCKLPQQYIDFLLNHNGGKPNLQTYPLKLDKYQWRLTTNTGWIEKFLSFSELYRKYIDRTDESYTMMPISGEDHDYLCLAVDPTLPDYGSVYFWLHGQTQDQSSFRRIALSFNHFLSMLTEERE